MDTGRGDGYQRGGCGFVVVMLLVAVVFAAGFLLARGDQIEFTNKVADAALTQLAAEKAQAETERDNAIAARMVSEATLAAEKTRAQKLAESNTALAAEISRLQALADEKDRQIASLQAAAQQANDVIPVTGNPDPTPSAVQPTSFHPISGGYGWLAAGFAVFGLAAAGIWTRRSGSRAHHQYGNGKVDAKATNLVLVRMTREEARQYARSRARQQP